MVINRVGPLSVAKLAGLLYASLGLIFGAIISLFAIAGAWAASPEEPGSPVMRAIFGAGAVIVLPILYGCMGFVMTFLMAAVYNASARFVGGVQIDVS